MAIVRFVLAVLLAGFGLGTLSTAALSAFPDRPIRFILSHPPGGSADVIARLMQPKLEKHSRPAGHHRESRRRRRRDRDGCALEVEAGRLHHRARRVRRAGDRGRARRDGAYDPLKAFAPVAGVSGQPFMLGVPANSPLKTVRDVIERRSAATPS